jgi:hypothetical protein
MGVNPGPPAAPDRRHRRWVHGFLAVFLSVLVLDVGHRVNGAHEALQRAINPPLLLTGLWQGPWRLYTAVPRDNLRVKAEVEFADHAIATWASPEFSQRSAVEKFVAARHMNYLRATFLAGNEPAWDGLCSYLARTLRHPDGKAVAVAQVTLSLRSAQIPPPPPPGERAVAAGPYERFGPWDAFHVWRPGT